VVIQHAHKRRVPILAVDYGCRVACGKCRGRGTGRACRPRPRPRGTDSSTSQETFRGQPRWSSAHRLSATRGRQRRHPTRAVASRSSFAGAPRVCLGIQYGRGWTGVRLHSRRPLQQRLTTSHPPGPEAGAGAAGRPREAVADPEKYRRDRQDLPLLSGPLTDHAQ
jgi:hypothetical protein